ncbi:Mss4-like protein [Podospora australis]|uniref:Translationally-controlled tumor protein homolog n=1 Tax=Podospora australis TaxID=1536484 RepID=A0AAN6WSH0_9PEZI|nr:Mss4-like protein [Podospora australis]
MLIFKDLITGDELTSDAYPMRPCNADGIEKLANASGADAAEDTKAFNRLTDEERQKLEDDSLLYFVEGAYITEGPVQVDTGANASAEEAEEGVEDQTVRVINVVNNGRLQSTSFDKKSFTVYIKGYLKAVKAAMAEKGKSPEYIKGFETKAMAFFKLVSGSFKDWDFYTGESMNPDGMVILSNYKADGTTPYFIFWKDGLVKEKI